MPSVSVPARHVVVVGHGMVGHRFVEAMRARDTEATWRITVLAEEADAAYDRVGLTGYTEHWDRGRLALPGNDYAGDGQVRAAAGPPGYPGSTEPPRPVVTADGERFDYDALVLATGSYAFVPPVPGHDLPGCHVYRTLDDLDAIRVDAMATLAAGRAPVGVVDRRRAARAGGSQCPAPRSGLRAHVVEMAPPADGPAA